MGSIIVLLGTLWPYSAMVVPFPACLYLLLLQVSRRSIRDLQRLDSVLRSPIQSVFAEALHGISSIRAYGSQGRYEAVLFEHVDVGSGAVLAFNAASRWLGVRLELLAALLSGTSAMGCWLMRDQLTPGLAGLCLVWGMALTISLNFNCMFTSQAEAAFTSVERMTEYSLDVPIEGEHADLDSWNIQGTSNGATIHDKVAQLQPAKGKEDCCLVFEHVSMRYRDGLPLVLNDVSFELKRCERVAVVGRTGSGKSSLAVALFRLAPLASGNIYVSGVNIANAPLDVARRSISIITQDPVMFSGTVRSNLDPFDDFSDEDCDQALGTAQLINSLKLHFPVDESGGNLSIGERQLLCLARVLLRRPRLLLCDEATSSVDSQTDAQVQNCLHDISSNGVALLTIAHRLGTIADYDRVMVLDGGRVVELDSVHQLLNANGFFRSLVDKAGVHEALAIRSIAASKASLMARETTCGSSVSL